MREKRDEVIILRLTKTEKHRIYEKIKKLCDGLNMSLGEFFSCPLFDDLEQEIQ